MASDAPFTHLTLTGAAARLRDGTTDPVRLVAVALDAIQTSQPLLNAFVTVDVDGATRAAAVARDELAGGRDRGPLHGLPVAVKDMVDTAGLVTTMGSRHFAGHRPERDAEVVRRLRAAGAIVVGKTTTHEFAFGPTGDRAANGPAANPHDPGRMAGGSSAGSAAAVAAGLVPLAVGTDTGGSVRIPAALCGVVGIRPTMGVVPADGVFPLAWSFDAVGVLAADAAGAALGWRVLTANTGTPPPLSTVCIGRPAGFDRLDGVVRARIDDLADRLIAGGAVVTAVDVVDAEELLGLYRVIQSAEAVAIHHDRLATAPELFDPEVRQRLEVAAEVPAHAYVRAMRRLAEVRAGAARLLRGFDLLLLPTVPILAPPLGTRDAEIGGGWTSPRDALLAHTVPWSVLGVPSMSIPVPGDGLPVGAQLVAAPGDDLRLLAAAGFIETVLKGQ